MTRQEDVLQNLNQMKYFEVNTVKTQIQLGYLHSWVANTKKAYSIYEYKCRKVLHLMSDELKKMNNQCLEKLDHFKGSEVLVAILYDKASDLLFTIFVQKKSSEVIGAFSY